MILIRTTCIFLLLISGCSTTYVRSTRELICRTTHETVGDMIIELRMFPKKAPVSIIKTYTIKADTLSHVREMYDALFKELCSTFRDNELQVINLFTERDSLPSNDSNRIELLLMIESTAAHGHIILSASLDDNVVSVVVEPSAYNRLLGVVPYNSLFRVVHYTQRIYAKSYRLAQPIADLVEQQFLNAGYEDPVVLAHIKHWKQTLKHRHPPKTRSIPPSTP